MCPRVAQVRNNQDWYAERVRLTVLGPDLATQVERGTTLRLSRSKPSTSSTGVTTYSFFFR